MDIIKIQNIESKIVNLREQKVILDRDVAEIYGVETKRVNEAVKNNHERFPEGYIFELDKNEGRGQHLKYLPKVFTEKGLYMLATILKSKVATQTTIAIIETFVKVKELTNTINELSTNPPKEQQQSLMQYNIVIVRRNDEAIFSNQQIATAVPRNDVLFLDNDLKQTRVKRQ